MTKKDERFVKVLDEGSAFGWQRTISDYQCFS